LDTERLEAQYTDGVLTVRLPIKEQAKPRRVSVAAGGAERTSIDAKTSDGDSDPVGAATS
jgi:HSP20 family protein